MRRISGVGLVALALLAPSGWAAPRLVAVGADSWDFGAYPANQEKLCEFQVANKGDAPLTIRDLRKTCSCLTAEIDKTSLAPGESATIRTRLAPGELSGPYQRKLYALSDDPRRGALALTLSGDARPIAVVAPSDKIHLGRLLPNVPSRKIVEIDPTEKGVRFAAPIVKSNYPLEVVAAPKKNGGVKLSIQIVPKEAKGPLSGEIRLPVESPRGWNDALVSLDGTVGLEFYAVPSALRFPASSDEVVEKTFELRLLGAPLDPDKIQGDVSGVRFDVAKSGNAHANAAVRVTACFDRDFIARLSREKRETLSFHYPGVAAPAEIVCVSDARP